jgi:mannose-1-phosphate guanylyltransferase
MKGMILAAGLGTRLRPYTDHFAKPALPFLNIPLLYYSVGLLESAGLSGLVVNAHYKPEQIEKLARGIPGARYSVDVSHEPGAPLGSGGGIWKAQKFLKDEENFFLANGDEVILPAQEHAFAPLVHEHLAHKALATISVIRDSRVGRQFGGVWADGTGRVHGFGKTPPASSETLTGFHYIGLQILNQRVFGYLPEGESNILYDALAGAIARGETVRAVETQCAWFETGNPGDFLEATGLCLAEPTYSNRFLQNIFKRFLPKFEPGQTADFSIVDAANVMIGNRCKIDSSVQMRGFAVIGDNVTIGAGVDLEDVVVLPKAKIPAGSKLKKQIVLPT